MLLFSYINAIIFADEIDETIFMQGIIEVKKKFTLCTANQRFIHDT